MTTAQDQQSHAELLPCAHCGSDKVALRNQDPDYLSGGYYIECQKCGASTGLRFACGEDPKPLLVEQWNRRALPAGLEPVGYAHAGNLANIGDGYAYLYPEQVAGLSVPLYTSAQVRALLDAANKPSGSRAVLRALLRPGSGS